MKKYLFDLPPRDLARKPYAVGLTPEVDAWAKANKHRIGTHRSKWCRPQYSAFVGNVDMLAELCTLYDDWGLIAYANTKSAAVQQLYENLLKRKATVEDALRFLLGYLQKPKEAAAAFGVDLAASAAGENPGGNLHNSLINAPAHVGGNPGGRKGGQAMKYLSVCSGIEAASVAWEPLGWEPVAFSEIEPFPSAVLAERFPDVPNLGDMTKYEEWNIPAIDLMVGGTPCQAFSVAGKRGSLADDRGNLCLTFCRMADHFRPRWVLWENVPGVLNTPDNAFGCLLAALCGADAPIIPTGGGRKHSNCGVVSGPKRTVAWRLFDAQWNGVPQRRKRVFVLAVAGAGNWASADALLPVGERVPRDLEACRKAWKEAAGNAGSRFEGSHWDGGRVHPSLYAQKSGVGLSNQELFCQRGAYLVPDVAPSVTSKWAKGTGGPAGDECQNLVVYENHAQDSRVREMGDVCSIVSAKYGTGGGNTPIVCIQGDIAAGRRGLQNGLGVSEDISFSLLTSTPHCVAYDQAVINTMYGFFRYSPIAATLTRDCGNASHASVTLVQRGYIVRRLTPRECERLQGFPDDWTMIPWRGKPAADCPDSHRYKAVGNSMAVPVMWYIGRRIQIVERRSA